MKAQPIIQSKIIIGARPNHETEELLRKEAGAGPHDEINPCVFQVKVGKQTRYCCWAGGEIKRVKNDMGGEPHLTLTGRGAMEALANLLFIQSDKFIFHELRKGKTPLREKVIDAFFSTTGSQAAICFVGDLAGELDGEMSKAFNLSGMVHLQEIAQ